MTEIARGDQVERNHAVYISRVVGIVVIGVLSILSLIVTPASAARGGERAIDQAIRRSLRRSGMTYYPEARDVTYADEDYSALQIDADDEAPPLEDDPDRTEPRPTQRGFDPTNSIPYDNGARARSTDPNAVTDRMPVEAPDA